MREDTKELLIFTGCGIGGCILVVLAFAGIVFALAGAIRWIMGS